MTRASGEKGWWFREERERHGGRVGVVVNGLGVSLGGENTFYCLRRLICDVMGQGGQGEWKSGRHYETGGEG